MQIDAQEILRGHSEAVAALALQINHDRALGLDPEQVCHAAMMHDVGIVATNAPGIGCHGTEPYIRHGIIGADMLRAAGEPEWVARVAERHTGAGLTPEDIARQGLPLPIGRILVPETTLERLICYADKFYSKRPGALDVMKSLEKVRTEMAHHGADTLARFEDMHREFGGIAKKS